MPAGINTATDGTTSRTDAPFHPMPLVVSGSGAARPGDHTHTRGSTP